MLILAGNLIRVDDIDAQTLKNRAKPARFEEFGLLSVNGLFLNERPAEAIVEPNNAKLEKWLDFVLPALEKAESGGNPLAENWEDAKITSEPSIGCYQFQPKTFIAYTKTYNLLPYAEDKEILNYIYDCEYQRELTKMILIMETDGWKHWKNSFIAFNIPKHQKEL